MRVMQPVYELNDEELSNPPWTNGNLDKWLYRPVKVRGRVVHSKEMKFRYDRYGFRGSLHFIPLMTAEGRINEEGVYANADKSDGLILGIGWIPANYDEVTNRFRWENSSDVLEYVGIVTTNEEINGKNKEPNIYDEQLFDVRML